MIRKQLAAFFLLVIAASCLLNACKKPQSTAVAIAHVAVIDMTGAPSAPDQTVLVDKEKIIALGPANSVSIPDGAKILDARGKFLIPGLNDMHLHLTGAGEPNGSRNFFLPLLLANGITSVRDMGGYLDYLIPLREEIDEGKRIGPHIVFAGPYLDGNPPSFQPSLVVNNRKQAKDDVHTLVKKGVDFIKVQSMLSRDAYFAIAQTCRAERVTFSGHVPDRVTAFEAADAGQRSIEHLTCELRACSSNEPDLMRKQFHVLAKKATTAQSKARQLVWQREVLDTYSGQKAAELIAQFKSQQTWQTPTLILLRNDAFPSPDFHLPDDPRSEYVPAKFVSNWRKNYDQQMKNISAEELSLRAAMLEKSLALVGQMQKGGVKILAGTDSAAPYVVPGFSLHEELALLVKAGLTPAEALQAATRNAAEFLGHLDSQGTVAIGKDADLVLLDANPLDDIHNTQKIRAVFVRGKFLDRAALDQLLADAEKFAIAN
ncbi:MAG TPA: amidohydrolase family protein [Candidatus Dormibacteraeota bacterium]|nr:amidohydrolase family protein [Candidatus Dormibacteraeota bacterium]